MAEPDPPARVSSVRVGVLVALVLTTGCGTSAPKPLETPAGTTESVPPPTESVAAVGVETTETEEVSPAPEPASESPTPQPTPQPAPQPENENESLVMIDTGARDVTERPQTLAEAARAERERRNLADPADIVITDQTLDEYATGQLTIASPANPDGEDSTTATVLREMEEREAFWRGRARDIRQAWRDAYDRIPELEEKVFQLRQAFFREDDGFYRDAEIKPAWDRAIEQLEEAHREVEARQLELAEFLEEGREAGALPGWLREGIDLEPQPTQEDDMIAEPGEPVIYEPEASDPP